MKLTLQILFAAFFIASASAAPPNVIVFLADDAGWGDYSFSGNTQLAIPNIDSIAQEGVSFDRFYVSPLCSLTRAEFLTGRYYPRTGVRGVSTGQERMNLDEKTIADSFRAAGYATGAFGKWHNGSQWPYHPMARGFATYFGHTAGHWGEYFDPPLEENGQMVRTQGYITDICVDRALGFIEENHNRPFFCYIPFTTPHSPWAAPAEDWTRFKDKEITLRADNPDLEDADVTRCVLAMMENQDRNVGRVLQKLRELRLSDNTILVYFSDNGPNSVRWNDGMKGRKGSVDEGGVRNVCYLQWAGRVPAGHRIPQIAGAIDLLPTLASLAGVPIAGEKPLDGLDLSPLLTREEVTDWPDRMIFSVSSWKGEISVRTQTHRLDGTGKLFDMIADPGQKKPINAREPALLAQLTRAVEEWRMQIPEVETLGLNAINAAKGKGGRTKLGSPIAPDRNAVDPRPFTVGYPEFPVTMLPARDGEPRGGLLRSASAPNCSYFVDWESTDASAVWNIEVATSGRYAVSVDYTCPLADAGAKVELRFGKSVLTGIVKPGWDPPLYTNQDTLPRPEATSQMKEFRTLPLGEMELNKGTGLLTMRALAHL